MNELCVLDVPNIFVCGPTEINPKIKLLRSEKSDLTSFHVLSHTQLLLLYFLTKNPTHYNFLLVRLVGWLKEREREREPQRDSVRDRTSGTDKEGGGGG